MSVQVCPATSAIFHGVANTQIPEGAFYFVCAVAAIEAIVLMVATFSRNIYALPQNHSFSLLNCPKKVGGN